MKHIIYGITTALCIALSGCEFIHDDPAELGYRENGEAYAYVSLTINTATDSGPGTRSNPTGGETGDGFEDGQAYENKVNDLVLFFYEGSYDDEGVNRTDNPNIIRASVSVSTLESGINRVDKVYKVGPIKIKGLKIGNNYHVLAVANMGTDYGNTFTDLNSLKNAVILSSSIYKVEEENSYSNFAMSSERDESPMIEILPSNSEDNPAFTSIDIERLVARVDYQAEEEGYGLTAETDKNITAKITRAMLVNSYNQPTYLLKRVANSWDATTGFDFLGDETTSNFVIDPNTSQKTATPIAANADTWYDNYFPNISDAVGEDGTTAWEKLLIKGWDIDGWKCIGYPRENTTSVEAQGKYYSTGVVFEATYEGIDGVTKGETFFRVDGKTLYADLEAAMSSDTDFDEDRTFKDWNDFQAYFKNLDENDPAGYKAWLKQFAEKDVTDNLSSLTWDAYKTNVLDYENGEPTAKTRQILHETGRTETFLNGKGYYTYWIKHNQGGSDGVVTGLPMQNAIVRNNIYKLTVRSIAEIGNDIPGDKTLDILVTVAQWNMLDKEEVEMQ